MDYSFEYLKALKSSNVSLKLLSSDNFAMTVSLFYQVFIKDNKRVVEANSLEAYFDDYLFGLNQENQNLFTKSAKEYLNDYIKAGYLRKFYNKDQLLYELSNEVYKVIEFMETLQRREFVGSETKLNMIMDLLEKLEFEASTDEERKIEILQNQIDRLQKRIEDIKLQKSLKEDDRKVKEIFLEILNLSKKLLYDFSEIEENFRELNRKTKEKIASRVDKKSKVLDFVFDSEKAIKESEEGKSFKAFWELLRSEENEKLENLIQKAYQKRSILEIDSEESLKSFKYDLMSSAHKVQILINRLVEQLREFIDQKAWIENKRVIGLIEEIQKNVLKLDEPLKESFEIKTAKVDFNLPFEKELFEVKRSEELKSEIKEEEIVVDKSMLFLKEFVNEEELKRNVKTVLTKLNRVSLKELISYFPVKKGIAEIVGYISVATNLKNTIFIENSYEKIEIEHNDKKILIKVPLIIFSK